MKHPKLVGSVALVATLGIGIGIGAGVGSSHTTAQTTVTKTVSVPGPTKTVNHNVVKDVPGPTKTVIKTVTVPAPPPPAGAKVATFNGTGTETTPAFNVPSSGDYIVAWSFSNNDQQGDGGDNFIMAATSQSVDTISLPNDIATSGHGSTEVTGDSGSDSFNVQADDTASWTVTITAAS